MPISSEQANPGPVSHIPLQVCPASAPTLHPHNLQIFTGWHPIILALIHKMSKPPRPFVMALCCGEARSPWLPKWRVTYRSRLKEQSTPGNRHSSSASVLANMCALACPVLPRILRRFHGWAFRPYQCPLAWNNYVPMMLHDDKLCSISWTFHRKWNTMSWKLGE